MERSDVSNRRGSTIIAIIAMTAALSVATPLHGFVWKVDADATGGNNGERWEDAFTVLQSAINAAHDGDQIWVAEGTYYPDEWYDEYNVFHDTNDRTKSFDLVSRVTLLGGYAGYGAPDPDERDIALYETKLSGDIDQDDPPGIPDDGNSYHVVRSDCDAAGTIIDGFTIEDGLANGHYEQHYMGAGIFVRGSALAVIRCTIRNNHATDAIASNGWGGGMACLYYSMGGGEPVGVPAIIDCVFYGNSAKMGGGALHLGMSYYAPVLNSLFYNNSSSGAGGAAHAAAHAGDMTLVNCTFAGNTCAWPSDGGGACYFSDSAAGALTNCILWGNSPDQIFASQLATVTVNYSDVQGGWTGQGEGNIDTDPFFVAGYRLDGDPDHFSPCVDAGDNTIFDQDAYKDYLDLDGDTDKLEAMPDLDITDRIVDHEGGLIVDMGAYESDLCPDANQDGFVNIADIFAILGAWGPCEDCPEDVDDNGQVNIDDIFAVLGNWGCGDLDPLPAPESIMDCIRPYASDPEDLATCIEAMMIIAEN